MVVKELMTKNPISVSESTSIAETSKIMKDNDIGALPVINDQKNIVGIVTDRDIVIRTVAESIDINTPVKNIMSSRVTSIEENKDVEQAISVMSTHRIRRLPVTGSDNKLVGMLSLGDIAITDDFMFEVSDMIYEISKPYHT